MLRSCCYSCFGGRRKGDGLLWQSDLNPHAYGDFSMAVVQANSSLEDQCQVLTSPSATYVGVYDGHGGPETSSFISRHLFPCLLKFATERGGLSHDVIKKAFKATEEDFTSLVKQSLPVKPQIASVGSCCLFGAVTEGQLFVANLGDSRAVLGRKGFDGEKSSVVPERLSRDHNVSNEDVRMEVEALHPDDSPVVIYCRGVWRIKGIIQVSRSIGDLYLKKPDFSRDPIFQHYANFIPMKRAVLSSEPSIVTRKLKPEDMFVIFASDGLWEQLTDEEAVQIVHKNPRAGIANKLIAAAIQQAAKKREVRYRDIRKIERGVRRHFHDDISVVVLFLDHHHRGISSIPRIERSSLGCVNSPEDIFSYNSEEAVEHSGDKVFPNEEARLRLAY